MSGDLWVKICASKVEKNTHAPNLPVVNVVTTLSDRDIKQMNEASMAMQIDRLTSFTNQTRPILLLHF